MPDGGKVQTIEVFGSSESIVIDTRAGQLEVSDDPYSDRVRCDHPELEDGVVVGRALLDAAERQGRGRVVVLSDPKLRPGLEAVGLQEEAVMPGFYNGERDCVVMGTATQPGRSSLSNPEAVEHVDALLRAKGAERAPPEGHRSRPATAADAPALAQLLAETFAQYPTPSDDPAYLAEQIESGTPFRVVEEDGEIIACASADIVAGAQTAELTDCATRPAARGRGLMRRILADLMDDLRARGFPTAFTLARARIPGINIAFSRLGFELRGRMVQSCRIGDGLEDMNVWSRAL